MTQLKTQPEIQPETQPETWAEWPLVSVIIPVLNDETGLSRCLAALAQQTYPRSQVEVIVIDNGSDQMEGLQRLAAAHQVTLIQELAPGAYRARNAGIALAHGEIIAFTDADCIPTPDWLERGVAYFKEDPNCGLVVGEVMVFPQDSRQPTLVELYQMVTAFPQEHHLKEYRGGATANVLTCRQVIERVGSFDATLKSFGDLEWGQRVFAAGYRQVYAPAVRVRHPARRTWGEMTRKNARVAGGVYDYFVKPEYPWLQRHKTYARLVWDDLTLVNSRIPTIARAGRGYDWGQRCRMMAVAFWLRCLSALEKTRLHFGGISERV